MTKPVGIRSTRLEHRHRCGKCGNLVPWGEVCVFCGASYSDTDGRLAPGAWQYYDTPIPEKLRVAHGQTCTAEGEPHKCHCHGGKTHPCNCYESPTTPIGDMTN